MTTLHYNLLLEGYTSKPPPLQILRIMYYVIYFHTEREDLFSKLILKRLRGVFRSVCRLWNGIMNMFNI